MKTIVKTAISCFLFLFFIGAQYGCKSTESGANQQPKPESSTVNKSEPNYGYTNILQMLRKESKLRISGSPSNPQIRVMGGGRSVSGSSEPLFVVDGAAVGRSYTSVRHIDVNLVRSINVISAANSGKYGARGSMGVIEINTKAR